MRRSVWLSLAVITPLLLLQCGRDQGEAQGEAKREGAAVDENLVLLTEAQEKTAHLTVTPAGAGSPERRLQVTGEIESDPDRVAKVSSPIGGRLIRVLADLGATVRSGQTLALMDSQELGDAEVAYLKSVAADGTARKSLDRARMLVEREAISVAELQQREAQAAQSSADVLHSEERLRRLGLSQSRIDELRKGASRDADGRGGSSPANPVVPIRSPLDGVLIERSAAPGEMVAADAKLFTVGNFNRLQVFFDVYEKDLGAVHPGVRVEFRTEATGTRTFDGTVDFVSPQVDVASRAARVRAVVSNSDRTLGPGMFVSGTIALPNEPSGGSEIVVPGGAVVAVHGRPHVFVREGPHTYRAVLVEIAERDAETVRIRSGVTPGQLVVTDGAFTLKGELMRGSLEEAD